MQSNRYIAACKGTLAVLGALAVLVGAVSGAQSLRNVTYVGGTALTGSGIHGKVLISSTDSLVFEGPTNVVVPYSRVISYESRGHKQVHVGLLTEGIWKLLAPWPEAKQLSLAYGDPEEHAQVIILQMSRADEALLVEVLKTRVPRGGYHPTEPAARPVILAQGKTADR